MNLISTMPDSKGKEAILIRAKHLSDFRWTPIRDVITFTRKTGPVYFPAGEEILGFPYSSTEPIDKFITENVSFETFLSAVSNPDSVLYTKSMNGDHDGCRWTYYGLVCNGFVRYAYNLNMYRYNTKYWLNIPGMRKIANAGEYNAEDIRLCDSIFAYGTGTRSHVAMITDILRDENGVIKQIEVSEGIRKSCARKRFDVDDYFDKFKEFNLCRYDFVDEVPFPDEEVCSILEKGVPKQLPLICVDNGDKSNYFYGDETLVSIFKDGKDVLDVYCDAEKIESISVKQGDKITRKFNVGYYKLVLKNGGQTEFCVVKPEISYTIDNNHITIRAKSCDSQSELSHIDFREGGYEDWASLCELIKLNGKEKESGVITCQIPENAHSFKVSFINKYGVWTHKMIRFRK